MKRGKRMKKHHLKRWSSSVINGSLSARKHTPGMRGMILSELGYAHRAQSLSKHNTDKFISLFVTKPRQQSIDRAKVELFKNRLEELCSMPQMERQIVLRNTLEEHLSLVYGHTGCFLIQTCDKGTIKRSIMYPNSVVAIERVKDHRIIWVEIVHASESPAAPT